MNETQTFVEADELKIPRGELLGAIQDAIRVADNFRSRAEASLIDHQLCPPQTMLAILTYCYLRGIYGSAEIEEAFAKDGELSVLADCRPDYELIRKFRRANRELVQQTLRQVRWFLWMKYHALGEESRYANTANRSPRLSKQIDSESSESICRAAFVDQMMMD